MQSKPADSHSAFHFQSQQPGEQQRCRQCTSEDKKEFNGELAIHFTGLRGLENPIVWVFPKMHVCMNCGFAEFSVPERELRVLAYGSPIDGALIWPKLA